MRQEPSSVSRQRAVKRLKLNRVRTKSENRKSIDDSDKISIGNDIVPIHDASRNGLTSILASMRIIPNLVLKKHSETRMNKNWSNLSNDPTEASTSSAIHRSILRDKMAADEAINERNRFFRSRPFWKQGRSEREKKSIIFANPGDSVESIVTMIGTARPLKSALRGNDSIGSGNSSSVRFSIPPEVPVENPKKRIGMKIGKWSVIWEIANDTDNDNWITILKSFNRTRFCKIAMSFTFGVIVPSFVVIPILVYKGDSND